MFLDIPHHVVWQKYSQNNMIHTFLVQITMHLSHTIPQRLVSDRICLFKMWLRIIPKSWVCVLKAHFVIPVTIMYEHESNIFKENE